MELVLYGFSMMIVPLILQVVNLSLFRIQPFQVTICVLLIMASVVLLIGQLLSFRTDRDKRDTKIMYVSALANLVAIAAFTTLVLVYLFARESISIVLEPATVIGYAGTGLSIASILVFLQRIADYAGSQTLLTMSKKASAAGVLFAFVMVSSIGVAAVFSKVKLDVGGWHREITSVMCSALFLCALFFVSRFSVLSREFSKRRV